MGIAKRNLDGWVVNFGTRNNIPRAARFSILFCTMVEAETGYTRPVVAKTRYKTFTWAWGMSTVQASMNLGFAELDNSAEGVTKMGTRIM